MEPCQITITHVLFVMLFFAGAFSRGRAYYGQGTGTIWLDQVQCGGYETNILDCITSSIGIEDCTHAQDASVVCTTSKSVQTHPLIHTYMQSGSSLSYACHIM